MTDLDDVTSPLVLELPCADCGECYRSDCNELEREYRVPFALLMCPVCRRKVDDEVHADTCELPWCATCERVEREAGRWRESFAERAGHGTQAEDINF